MGGFNKAATPNEKLTRMILVAWYALVNRSELVPCPLSAFVEVGEGQKRHLEPSGEISVRMARVLFSGFQATALELLFV